MPKSDMDFPYRFSFRKKQAICKKQSPSGSRKGSCFFICNSGASISHMDDPASAKSMRFDQPLHHPVFFMCIYPQMLDDSFTICQTFGKYPPLRSIFCQSVNGSIAFI